jgi:tRNA threonylcarbamoyladenosine biosynthesis protein TsaE
MKITTINSRQTKKLGQILAEQVLKTSLNKQALVFGLEGDLGSGKTTFLQGFAKGLKIKQTVLSPTFILMHKFKINKKNNSFKFKFFYHVDCYRLNSVKEFLNLDFKKNIDLPENIIAIEWADKIKKILPQNTIWIEFKYKDKNKREISFN